MTRVLRIAVLVLVAAVPAAAQTKGKISVGAAAGWVRPTDSEVRPFVGFGPLVRLNPKKGWGVAAGLSWFRANLDHPESGDRFAQLQVRPLMAGVGYTFGNQPVLASVSIVAGPSFNDLDFRGGFKPPAGSPEKLDVKTSVAVRGGFGVTWTVASRVAIVGFAGYMVNRPDIVYRNPAGREFTGRWKADAVIVSTGLVFSLF